MFTGLCIATANFIVVHYDREGTKQDFFLNQHPWYVWACLFYLGVAMITQQATRNKGLAIASDSSVTVVLYAEVAFSFVWDVFVLGTSPDRIQWYGAAVIVLGSVLSAILKSKYCHKHTSPLVVVKDEEVTPHHQKVKSEQEEEEYHDLDNDMDESHRYHQLGSQSEDFRRPHDTTPQITAL
jgi:drug/metabolite transporter superfamily protein YnfA